MKKRILLFTIVAGITSFALSSYHNGAARNGYDCTGAETAGPDANVTGCAYPGSGCHSTSATTSIGVAIELDSAGGVPTTHYKGGLTYTVKLTGTPTGTSNTSYGFQLNALKGAASSATANVDAGTWSATLPSGTRISAPVSGNTQLTTVEQSATQVLSGGTFTQSFSWTAPAAGTGDISFWAAVNFVNGNTVQDIGDLWNTNHAVINEWSIPSSVANVAANISLKAYPNPVINNLSLQMDNTQTGAYSLVVFDMTGKTITTQTIVVDGTSHTGNINTTNWLPGNYHVVIEKDGNRQVIAVTKI